MYNQNKTKFFKKGAIFGDITTDDFTNHYGLVRYNANRDRFEGLHRVGGTGPGGADDNDMNSNWREFTTDIASETKIGGFKVGSNLDINPTTGVLASVTAGQSRIFQQVITVGNNNLGDGDVNKQDGDYQSITEAISHALGTSANNYTDGSLTTPGGANFLGTISASNPYIILVGPGTYPYHPNEITIPDHVHLIGDISEAPIIKTIRGVATGTDNINSSLIKLGNNCSLQNIKIQLDSGSDDATDDKIIGIYSNSSNNTIKNVIIETIGNASDEDTFGIYMDSGSGHLLSNITFNLSLATVSIYGLYLHSCGANSDILIKEITSNITSSNTNSYGIYISNSKNCHISNSNIYINNADNKYGIYVKDSDCIVKYSEIETEGDTDIGSDNSFAIYCDPTTGVSKTLSDITFTHHVSRADTIQTATTDLGTDGFLDNSMIKISGASTTSNNKYYQIGQITSTTIYFNEENFVVTESAGASVTIEQLHSVSILYSTLKATSLSGTQKTINVATTGGDATKNDLFHIECKNCQLLGGSPSPNTSRLIFEQPQIILVAKRGGHYSTLAEAINSIVDNNQFRRYCIKIASGNYSEPGQITCKEYVDIEGESPQNTILKFNVSNNNIALSSGLLAASNSRITNLHIENITTSNNNHSSGIYTTSKSNIIIDKCFITCSGTGITKYGAYFESTDYKMYRCNFNILAGAGANTGNLYGIYNNSCGSTDKIVIETTSVKVDKSGSNTGQNHIGIYNQDTHLHLISPFINIKGGVNSDKGVVAESSGSTNYSIIIQEGEIIIDTVGSYNYAISLGNLSDDDNYTILVFNTRLEGDVNFTPSNPSNPNSTVKCFNCYSISGTDPIIFTPLNFNGEDVSSGNKNNIILNDSAGKQGLIGLDNILLGENAANSITTANRNIILGNDAAQTITNEDDNVIIGYQAGQNTIASENVFVGNYSGRYVSSGQKNTFVGFNAGYGSTSFASGNHNVIIGDSSGYNLTSGSDNVFLGAGSGYNNSSGSKNIFIGGGNSDDDNSGAGKSNTTGSQNLIIGYQAGFSSNTVSDNIFYGYQSGYNTTTGDNIFMGSQSGYTNVGGLENIFIGKKSGFTNNSGDFNLCLGNSSGYSLTSGNNNIMMGKKAGYNNTTGSSNICIGSETANNNDSAGFSNQTGSNNIFMGVSAGKSATSDNNVIIGTNAAKKLTSGGNNIVFGFDAASNNMKTTSDSIFIGKRAGYNYGENSFTGSGSIMIGSLSGENSNKLNTFIGSESGQFVDGANNVFLGYRAGKAANSSTTPFASASENICIGALAGLNITTGTKNIILGSSPDLANSTAGNINTGANNIIMGYKSGNNLQDGSQNILLGTESGKSVTSNNNIMIGYQSGFNEIGGESNIMIGDESGYSQSGGTENIFIGSKSGFSNNDGNFIINIGDKAGFSGVDADNNINLGFEAGYFTTSNNSIAIGYKSGRSNTTGSNNIFIGSEAGGGSDSDSDVNLITGSITGTSNMMFGNKSGKNLTTGLGNILFGFKAGENITTGSKNILIGNFAGKSDSNQETKFNRNIMIGIASNTINAGTNDETELSSIIGIGSKTTKNDNIFIGVDVGLNNETGNNNIFMGKNAGRNNTTGEFNINIGTDSSSKTISGTNNISIGQNSNLNNIDGDNNIAIGRDSGMGNTERNPGDNNISIGFRAGFNNATNDSIFIGNQAGKENILGVSNIYIGKNSGLNSSFGYRNIAIGEDAGKNLDSAKNINKTNNLTLASYDNTTNLSAQDDLMVSFQNIMIGFRAGINTNSYENLFIGSEAGATNSAGFRNIFIGSKSGFNSTSNYNIFLGAESGLTNNSGQFNLFMGYQSGYSNTTGGKNSFLGYQSGYSSTNGSNNFYMGYHSGLNNNNGNQNVFIGTETGKLITSGFDNIFIGHQSGNQTDVNSSQNIYLGTYTGYKNTGNNNIFISSNNSNLKQNTQTIANKFIVFNDNIGTPLLYGDLTNNQLAINNNNFTTTISETAAKLVINGAVIANGYTPFTGLHLIKLLDDASDITPGMILISSGTVEVRDTINTIVSAQITNEENSKKVYGVYAHSEIIEETTQYYCASLGEGCILVTNKNGELQNGDYVVSSAISGYGMKQSDDLMRSCTVAKITQDIDWSSISNTIDYTTSDNITTSYKYILASCTYHCG